MSAFYTYLLQAYLPGVAFFGLKGAAIAAFGDNPRAFWPGLLTDRDEGVKLGESTLNFFFPLQFSSVSFDYGKGGRRTSLAGAE